MNEIRQILDQYKDIALSDSDIMELMKGKANIVRYRDVKKYKTIEDLLRPYDVCFILYEWKEHFGHWIVLIKDDDLIEYFDSYGEYPDHYIDEISEPFRTESGQNDKTLSRLMLKYDGDLSYNEYQFQKLDNNIKDCGRWCVLRAQLKDLPLKSIMINIIKKIDLF